MLRGSLVLSVFISSQATPSLGTGFFTTTWLTPTFYVPASYNGPPEVIMECITTTRVRRSVLSCGLQFETISQDGECENSLSPTQIQNPLSNACLFMSLVYHRIHLEPTAAAVHQFAGTDFWVRDGILLLCLRIVSASLIGPAIYP